jgi:predicted SAM-dependent methyltransferase
VEKSIHLTNKYNYLNLGCGYRYSPHWTNVNFNKSGDGVIKADLTNGIPFIDKSFDMVYHSHLLEHLPKNIVPFFLKECYRVLRTNGILRIAVPDLESIVRQYLIALEHSKAGLQDWIENYDWIMLEMYDQVVRHVSGGEMTAYLSKLKLHNESFVIDRCGYEVKNILEQFRNEKAVEYSNTTLKNKRSPFINIFRLFKDSSHRRTLILNILLSKEEIKALEIGRFRLSGEVHQWMYDSFSLSRLLKESGFNSIILRSAENSYLKNWSEYHLDIDVDGSIYKPDSIYIEALRS